MIENFLRRFQRIKGPEKNKREFIALAKELSESQESFPFPGIEPEAHAKMKATDEEFPGYTLPTDTVLDQCRSQGIKVVLGKDPNSGNIFIVPAHQRNENETSDRFINPKHLQINEMMDARLRKLTLLQKGLK